MSKFKVGDKVVRKEEHLDGIFTKDEVFVVTSVSCYGTWIKLNRDDSTGRSSEWCADYFDLAPAPSLVQSPAIDWTKPVQTKKGVPVTVLTTEARHSVYKVMAYVGEEDWISSFMVDGRYTYAQDGHPKDLENIPEPKKEYVMYINVYPDGKTFVHESREKADETSNVKRIACKRLVIIEGEYDE